MKTILWPSLILLLFITCSNNNYSSYNKNILISTNKFNCDNDSLSVSYPSALSQLVCGPNASFSVSRINKFHYDTISLHMFLDKMLIVRGKVFDIVKNGNSDGSLIILSEIPYSPSRMGDQFKRVEKPFGTIRCFFKGDLPTLNKGDIIEVKGKLNGIKSIFIDFVCCSLI